MKFNLTTIQKKYTGICRMAVVFVIAVSFSSCKTDVQQPESISALAITNVATKSSSYDFYIGNQKVANLPYGQKVGYIGASPGIYSGTVTDKDGAKSLYSANFTLINGAYHSLYILSKGDSISYLNVKDEFVTPPSGKARVRFINLGADAPAVSLEITGDTTTFTALTYKNFTAFKSVSPQTAVTINLRDKTTNAVLATLPNVEFRDQSYYTVLAQGLINTTDATVKLSLQVSKHVLQ